MKKQKLCNSSCKATAAMVALICVVKSNGNLQTELKESPPCVVGMKMGLPEVLASRQRSQDTPHLHVG